MCDVPFELAAVNSVEQVGQTAMGFQLAAAEAGRRLKNSHTLEVRLPCERLPGSGSGSSWLLPLRLLAMALQYWYGALSGVCVRAPVYIEMEED